jgi:acylphosphatase
MKQMHIWVSGFVQGVGYRAFTRREAKKLDLVGWVTNLEDRRVEAVVQGSQENLEKLLVKARHGSYFAQVKNIVVEWEEPTEKFSQFIIIR